MPNDCLAKIRQVKQPNTPRSLERSLIGRNEIGLHPSCYWETLEVNRGRRRTNICLSLEKQVLANAIVDFLPINL